MRKRVISSEQGDDGAKPGEEWLDLDRLAEVEITSEDPDHPVEEALVPGQGGGWRAAEPGPQTIRLLFGEPQLVQRIRLEFEESAVERTQEFTLRASQDRGVTFQELVRQQWNFSPQGANHQTEELRVDLAAVTELELTVKPDISGGQAKASLESFRVG